MTDWTFEGEHYEQVLCMKSVHSNISFKRLAAPHKVKNTTARPNIILFEQPKTALQKRVAKTMGRPFKELKITPEQYIYDMSAQQCTINEISSNMGISVATFIRRFLDLYHAGREAGKARIRTKLFSEAMDGNTPVLTFVAKNYLGMTDKASVELTGPNQGPIQVENVTEQLQSRIDGLIARSGAINVSIEP